MKRMDEVRDEVTTKVVDKVAEEISNIIIRKITEVGSINMEDCTFSLSFKSLSINIDSDDTRREDQ